MLSTVTVLYQDKGETEKTASIHSRLRSPAVYCGDQPLDLSYILHLPLDQNSTPCWLINQKPFAVSFSLSFFNSGGQKTPFPASLAARNGYMFHFWPRSYKHVSWGFLRQHLFPDNQHRVCLSPLFPPRARQALGWRANAVDDCAGDWVWPLMASLTGESKPESTCLFLSYC